MFKRKFDPFNKKRASVLGAGMAYVEYGRGDPIVFLHGNPTSSFLWRRVIPELGALGRCVAPDLIGMGDSDKVASGPQAYRFADHQEYLEAFLEVVGVESNVLLVGHDWGGVLAFDWARRNATSVKGIAYMETIVTPVTWEDWPEPSQRIFRAMRSRDGEEIVLDKNVFVEKILPASVLGDLSPETMDVYRAPYIEPGESRRPTLTWPREIPIDGDPMDVREIVSASEKFMAESFIPKLFINAKPGSILVGRQREVCRVWPNQREVSVPGYHFIQEDSGLAIGTAIADWIESI